MKKYNLNLNIQLDIPYMGVEAENKNKATRIAIKQFLDNPIKQLKKAQIYADWIKEV